MKYPLAPDGVFWTIQGEGHLRGTPMAFIRLAGCSVGCAGCDTNYTVSKRESPEDIAEQAYALWRHKPVHPESVRWVWITGGEPSDHDLGPLILALRQHQLAVAVATAGIRRLSDDISFLSVSPHRKSFIQTAGDELKVIPWLNGVDLNDFMLRDDLSFRHYFVQPFWGSPESLRQCVQFVLANPLWRLTDQGHKSWGLP